VEQIAFIALLQTILGFAIARIERLEGSTGTVPYAVRQHWSLLLGSDALQMHYQPLMDLKTGQITKVEALARLRDGDRLLTPGEFFPALSSDDFLELYARGLRQVLSQRSRWLRDGIDLNVSVNLPPTALSDNRYLEATQQALAECDCAPGGLTLEILETDAFPPGVDVLRELTKFKSLGIKLAEDDLGSGHSSLNRLREVPFDLVKIDRNISNLAGRNASDSLRFICQLVRLGHSLGKTVVVEGIEDAGMLEAVVILGADVAQGYTIASPIPVEQVAKWLGSQPGLPDFRRPDTHLGKLAKRLVRGERLHLMSEPRLLSIHAVSTACIGLVEQESGMALPELLPACRQVCRTQSIPLSLKLSAKHRGFRTFANVSTLVSAFGTHRRTMVDCPVYRSSSKSSPSYHCR
jgi:EAL domain-containing protein (putative c-di-GMP-specific phosphodiesterase class I)